MPVPGIVDPDPMDVLRRFAAELKGKIKENKKERKEKGLLFTSGVYNSVPPPPSRGLEKK